MQEVEHTTSTRRAFIRGITTAPLIGGAAVAVAPPIAQAFEADSELIAAERAWQEALRIKAEAHDAWGKARAAYVEAVGSCPIELFLYVQDDWRVVDKVRDSLGRKPKIGCDFGDDPERGEISGGRWTADALRVAIQDPVHSGVAGRRLD